MTVFTFRFGSATDVGLVRELNQDSLVAGPRLFAIADGMGGQAAGEVASALAIETFVQTLAQRAEPPDSAEVVAAAVAAANDQILAAVVADPTRFGMGTTLTGCGLASDAGTPAMMVFNVGDSRVYRMSEATFGQVTVDHSEVQELLTAGVLDEATAATYPRRNVITRSLGSPEAPIPDTWLFPIVVGDRYLACSDGLTNELTDDGIEAVLREVSDPAVAATTLVNAANAAGGRDNTTVIVVDLVPASMPDA